MTPAEWVPIEWPAAWGPGQFSLLHDSPFNAIAFTTAPPPALAAAARAAGLQAPTLAWRPWKEIGWTQPADVLAIEDGFWPAYSWKGVADGTAGPTGEPWLDANGWLYLYARSRGPGRAVWLRSDPPKDLRTVRQAHLQLLLAEAFAYGGRRPLWLPPEFAVSLAGGHSRAVDDWNKLAAMARWFEAHSAWRSWPVVAPLIILSDFSGDNEYVAGETMLLSARQQAPFWPLYAPAATATDFTNRRSALYLDQAAPEPKLAALLQSFARSGGLVLPIRVSTSTLSATAAWRWRGPPSTIPGPWRATLICSPASATTRSGCSTAACCTPTPPLHPISPRPSSTSSTTAANHPATRWSCR